MLKLTINTPEQHHVLVFSLIIKVDTDYPLGS